MKLQTLVERYIDAWNRRDVAAVLALMHKGAAYYDAFWMENCVGHDLAQYFQDTFDEDPFWYQQVGDTIVTESGVVYRYSAHKQLESKADEPIYDGAEVLNLRDGLILTVSDYYCNPARANLVEVARLATKRHGVSSHTRSGLGAMRVLRVRNRLSELIAPDEGLLNSSLTVSQLADRIGCTADQLLRIIDAEYGTKFSELVGKYSSAPARDVLPDIPHHKL